ncbi:MAG: TlpA disulfide reductase family protein, partial [Myxococcota bacterium]|nr:TlpA disulfide reductase family protein [Myxococcota bacterium]
ESDYLKERVVRILADVYLRELAQREAKDAETEKAILSSGLGDLTEGRILTEVCLAFIEQRMAPSLVSSCIQKMEQNKHQDVYGAHVSILKGLDLVGKGKGKEAIPFLDDGMAKLEVTPDFREEIAGIYKELGESKKACAQFENIYIDAPRWPGLQENLAECGSTDTLTEKLDAIRKESILKVRIENPQVVSPLVLSDESDNALSLELSKDSKLRVLVFFATWCPHCQEEMPHLVEFYGQLQESDLKDKAEIVAVRTAISRESLEFSLFKKVFKIPFEIMTDKGITFETFAKEQGIQASYPTVAIANQKGEIVYYLPRNSHGDTSKELFWLLRSLL